MIETHPFGIFAPKNMKYLLLGSFIALRKDESYDWFYGTKRNQFWPIIEEVYGVRLPDKNSRVELFSKLSIGIADLILQCERRDGNSQDNNLINIVYNTEGLTNLFSKNKINKVFFSSRFVEDQFRKNFRHLIKGFPGTELITLPSPSPRYALISRQEKIRSYKEHLPKLE